MATIDELMAQFALPDEERKRLLLGNVLLGIGGGLMSGRRGNEIGALGSGAVVGAQMGQRAISDAQSSQLDRLKLREALQGQIDKEELRKKTLADQAEIGQVFTSGPQLQNMGPGGPTPQNAAAVAPPNQIEKYRKAAELYAAKGNVEAASKLSAIADKMEAEYSTSPQTVRGPDGKLQLVQFSNRGGTKVAEGMTPAEKLHFATTGGMTGVGLDPYSGAQVSGGLPVTMDPAQADASNRGWAGLTQAERHFQATQGKEKAPQWDSASGQFVYPPTKENPTGAAVAPKGYTPKQERPSDQQLATGGFLDRMQFASKYIDAIEKNGYEPGAGQAAVNALKNVPLIGGTLGWAAESGQNYAAPESAAYKNVQEAWIRAKLRKESGAVIGVDEMEGERRTFFPQPNDPPEVRKQKAALRKQVELSMVKQARGGFQGGAGQEDPLGLR